MRAQIYTQHANTHTRTKRYAHASTQALQFRKKQIYTHTHTATYAHGHSHRKTITSSFTKHDSILAYNTHTHTSNILSTRFKPTTSAISYYLSNLLRTALHEQTLSHPRITHTDNLGCKHTCTCPDCAADPPGTRDLTYSAPLLSSTNVMPTPHIFSADEKPGLPGIWSLSPLDKIGFRACCCEQRCCSNILQHR